MYKLVNLKMAVLLLVVMAIGGLLMGSAIGADETFGILKIHDGARPVQDNGSIMEIDYANNSIVVGEIQYVVGRFMLNDKVHITQLMDSKGNKVELDFFRENQWVVVSGHKVGNSKVYTKEVQVVAKQMQKDRRTIKRLKAIK